MSPKSIDLENSNTPRRILKKIREDLTNLNSENVKSVLTIDKPNYRDTIIISREGDDIRAEKFMTKHTVSGGGEVLFENADAKFYLPEFSRIFVDISVIMYASFWHAF